ncbi:Flp family type IVb pilin [Nocardioides litoris]|uniref:Flp family type IVb pilin n=1 Tax=Nocardioides litoris TaxID=1926648 RepID=UPI00111D1421|nr:Flp family type IVb pilin [Nocardioides litoris]
MLSYTSIQLRARAHHLDDRGASAVEYGLLVAGIAIAILLAVFTLGDTIEGLFSDVDDQVGNRG